jgi:O-succinylbenzoate synthase
MSESRVRDVVVRRACLYDVAIRLKEPFRISGGAISVRRSLIVELEDDLGHFGYGESAPFEKPFYSEETLDSARWMLENHFIPLLVARPVAHPGELLQLLTDGTVGNRMALAGVESAWWDLCAERDGEPLSALVTARLRELGVTEAWLQRSDRVECGIALGIPEDGRPETIESKVGNAIHQGYRRVKLKVKPGWDVEPVMAARRVLERLAPGLPLTVDANGAYDLENHWESLVRLDRQRLTYIEQPLPGDALWDLRKLGTSMATPICLDESLTCDAVARQVVEMGGPLVWNIKVQRVGGLEEACRIYTRAASSGARVWGGTMPETGIGVQAMLALGCHAGFCYPSDLEPSDRWYAAGSDTIEVMMEPDGTMKVPLRRPPVRRNGWRQLAEIS